MESWKADFTADRTVTLQHPHGHQVVIRFNPGPANEMEFVRTHWQGVVDTPTLRREAAAEARKIGRAQGWTY